MTELEPLRCKCCGGPYNPENNRCDYCGTWYRKPSSPHYHILLAAAQCGAVAATAKAFERLAPPRGLL